MFLYFFIYNYRMETFSKRIMVFDTETNGLPTKTFKPHILQLSFIIYDANERKVVRVFNTYIRVPDSVYIPPKITELTGITKTHCASGIPMKEALREFYFEYQKCDIIVAHNIKFDKDRIRDEIDRYGDQLRIDGCEDIDRVFSYDEPDKLFYCTMLKGVEICNLMMDVGKKEMEEPTSEAWGRRCGESESRRKMSSGLRPSDILGDEGILTPEPQSQQSSCLLHVESLTPGLSLQPAPGLMVSPTKGMIKKKPKLEELYQHLYGNIPSGLHDSLVDTNICFQCFIRMVSIEEPLYLPSVLIMNL